MDDYFLASVNEHRDEVCREITTRVMQVKNMESQSVREMALSTRTFMLKRTDASKRYSVHSIVPVNGRSKRGALIRLNEDMAGVYSLVRDLAISRGIWQIEPTDNGGVGWQLDFYETSERSRLRLERSGGDVGALKASSTAAGDDKSKSPAKLTIKAPVVQDAPIELHKRLREIGTRARSVGNEDDLDTVSSLNFQATTRPKSVSFGVACAKQRRY